MTGTGRRFDQYSQREPAVFSRFLDSFDRKRGFNGIKEALGEFMHHPDGIKEYDIRCETERGCLTFDIQESRDFSKYGDVRIDYVSSFTPASYRTQSLSQFRLDMDARRVTVEKWGKVVAPRAEFLVFEFPGAQTFWQIYNLRQLNSMVRQLEKIGQFRTNKKYGEEWGSAFLAVKERHQILQDAKPRNLEDILSRAKPRV